MAKFHLKSDSHPLMAKFHLKADSHPLIAYMKALLLLLCCVFSYKESLFSEVMLERPTAGHGDRCEPFRLWLMSTKLTVFTKFPRAL